MSFIDEGREKERVRVYDENEDFFVWSRQREIKQNDGNEKGKERL